MELESQIEDVQVTSSETVLGEAKKQLQEQTGKMKDVQDSLTRKEMVAEELERTLKESGMYFTDQKQIFGSGAV